MSHAPAAALKVNVYLDRLPVAAQSYVRTDARLEGVQEASSSGSSAEVTAGADLPLLGLEGAIRKVGTLWLNDEPVMVSKCNMVPVLVITLSSHSS